MRERDLNALLVEAVVYGAVELMNRVQTGILAGSIAPENKVERTITEGFEGHSRHRIVQYIWMFRCDGQDQVVGFTGVGFVGDPNGDYNAVNEVAKRPVE